MTERDRAPLVGRAAAALVAGGWTSTPSDAAPTGEHHWLLQRPAHPIAHPVLMVVHVAASTIVAYSVLPERVPERRRTAVMELVTRANHGLLQGHFELDLDDGEVRFATAVHVTDGVGAGQALDEALEDEVAHLLAFNLAAFAVYADAIRAVAAGDVTALDAIAAVEQR